MKTVMIRTKALFLTLSLLLSGAIGSISITSCEQDEIVKIGGIGANCDTNNVSFRQFIQPLIDKNCKGCHNSSKQFAGINLEGYLNIKIVAQSGKLISSLYRSMGAYINNECDKTKIQAWINQGLKEN